MSIRDPKLFIDDIIRSINKVELYIKGITFTEFEKDNKTIDATIRNLEIIGEAVKNLPREIIEKFPSDEWRGATTMRDRLIHGYIGVDISIVWETISTDLPKLKNHVERIWEELNR